jgi:hypothetical protein
MIMNGEILRLRERQLLGRLPGRQLTCAAEQSKHEESLRHA